MIDLAAERFTKNLWSEREIGPSGRSWSPCATRPTRRATSSSACWKTARPGLALKAQAVLFRASHHSGPLEVELTRRNIPFVKFGGLKFLEAAHVKDVLALLRWAENPRDRVAGFRVLQLLPGVGPATAASTCSIAWPSGPTRWRRWTSSSRRRAAAEHWPDFVERFGSFAGDGRLAGRARCARAAGTSRIWSASTTMRMLRQADLLQLEQIAAAYPTASAS